MLHLDLFSGIGGFALACEWAGIETIGFVEIDKFCQQVLRKHWPNVPIVEDIRGVEKIKEIVANAKCKPSEEETTERQEYQQDKGDSLGDVNLAVCSTGRENSGIAVAKSPAILITAGFPCQPFSVAGKRGGKEDDRYLWPETLAVIEAIKPKWVLLENVAGIINLALDTVLSDLEGADYSTETLVIPACAVNAQHRRDRVWILANAINNTDRTNRGQIRETDNIQGINRQTLGSRLSGRTSQDVAYTEYAKTTRQRGHSRQIYGITESKGFDSSSENWWAVEPELGKLADGLPAGLVGYLENEPNVPRVSTGVTDGVSKLKALGNSIYWPVAYEIIRVIREVDDNMVEDK